MFVKASKKCGRGKKKVKKGRGKKTRYMCVLTKSAKKKAKKKGKRKSRKR